MNEGALRDDLINNLHLIEVGLTFIAKEFYLAHSLGTRGFIDILAKDKEGKLVVIEVKKQQTATREALHEVLKYLEGIKLNKGLRDDEIRLIIISTEWKELLIPFSAFYHNTSINLEGYKINTDESFNIQNVEKVLPLKINNGRIFSHHHMAAAYTSKDNLQKGLLSYHENFKIKGIYDYILVVLSIPDGFHEVELQSLKMEMKHIYLNLNGIELSDSELNEKLSDYTHPKYVIYSAVNYQEKEKYWNIIKTDKRNYNEILEGNLTEEMNNNIDLLHESALHNTRPFPYSDDLTISYPARFREYLDVCLWDIDEIIRGERFASDEFLSDETIIDELRGGTGTTKTFLKQRFSSINRSEIHTLKKEINHCLSDNAKWRVPLMSIFDELIEKSQNMSFDGEISIFNPMHMLYTIYLVSQDDNKLQWIPRFQLLINYNSHDRKENCLVVGALRRKKPSQSVSDIVKNYYGTNDSVVVSLVWGGYHKENIKIARDLGLEYYVFMIKTINDHPLRNPKTNENVYIREFTSISYFEYIDNEFEYIDNDIDWFDSSKRPNFYNEFLEFVKINEDKVSQLNDIFSMLSPAHGIFCKNPQKDKESG